MSVPLDFFTNEIYTFDNARAQQPWVQYVRAII